MIGAISAHRPVSYQTAYAYAPGRTAQAQQSAQAQSARQTGNVWAVRRSSPEAPVEPVRPVKSVSPQEYRPNPLNTGLPTVREGADPAEMAVRMRIRYAEPEPQQLQLPGADSDAQDVRLPGSPAEEQPEIPGLPAAHVLGQEAEDAVDGIQGEDAAVGAEAVQEAAEEGKCETCEKRKYQDESDDSGVSFQTPTNIAPQQVASAVRGHEMEHVVREQAKAQREDRRVVSQSVTYHTAICPECGKAYVSGGTTRTVTAAAGGQDAAQQQQQEQGQGRVPFSAVA